jgi:chloramphenicol-sensitive protein RarD
MVQNYLAIAAAFIANIILGASSIYWHIFDGASPLVLVVYRIAMSLILLAFICIICGRIKKIIREANSKVIITHATAAILVAINWATFIWASINGNVLESGLGYLVAPVVVMGLSLLFYHESGKNRKVAGCLSVGIVLLFLVIQSGELAHWVYLTIGTTWGLYTLLKKITPFGPIDGLLIETVVLAILIAMCIPVITAFGGEFSSDEIIIGSWWIYVSGVVSITPLLLFAFAARSLQSYNMGMLQFVLPTTQLVVSLFYYNQTLPLYIYICFVLIWCILFFVVIGNNVSIKDSQAIKAEK